MFGKSITVSAPAKINLSLRLPARFPDGFHSLCSLMIPMDLCDTITLCSTTDGLKDHNLVVKLSNELKKLRSVWCQSDPEESESFSELNSSGNSVLRALTLILQESDRGNSALNVEILKEIPLRSGLGGGSSDAAAVLIAVNRLLGLEFSLEKLYKIGAKIGSDVCAALARSIVFVSGRGERIHSVLLSPATQRWFEMLGVVIVRPEVGISTPLAYAKYRALTQTLPVVEPGSAAEEAHCAAERSFLGLEATQRETEYALCWNESDPWREIARIARNDFESCLRVPAIAEAKRALIASGARVAILTGSGSACAGIFESSSAAHVAGEELKRRHGWLVITTSFRPSFGL